MKKKKLSTIEEKNQDSKDKILALDSANQLNSVLSGWVTKTAYVNSMGKKLVLTTKFDGTNPSSSHCLFDVAINRYTGGAPVKICIAAYMGSTDGASTQSYTTSNESFIPTLTKNYAARTLIIEIPLLSQYSIIYISKSIEVANNQNRYNSDFMISIEDA